MRRTLIASVCLCLLALAGCGGGGEAAKVSAPKTTATPSASTTAVAPRGPAAPSDQTNTVASAKQFAVHALRLTTYAYEHRDIAPLEAVALPATCHGCRYAEKYVQQEVSGRFKQTSDGPPRVTSNSIRSRDQHTTEVKVVFDMPGGKEIADSGKVRDSIDPAPGSVFRAVLDWDSDDARWRLRNSDLTWGKK